MQDLRSMTLAEMESFFTTQLGEKRFRALQTYEWINKKHALSIEEMTNLSNDLRLKLARCCYLSHIQIRQKRVASDGLTTKYLFELEKDTIIESVSMQYAYGRSVCCSSQAGCRMGCVFCASAHGGLSRSLTAGEMCAQVYEIQKDLGQRVSRVVVMGSGEPFDNYDSLIGFLRIITSKNGLCIGARHITVSTCGLPDQIRSFADEGLQVGLAVSLHAAHDELRKTLMPGAGRYGLDALLSACAAYASQTGRRVTFEYALIDGVNDLPTDAEALGKRLAGTPAHVNLIPLNEVPGGRYRRSGKHAVEAFAKILDNHGVNTTVRRELGSDINGACGQLRRTFIENTERK